LIYYARHLIKATEALAPGEAPLAAAAGVQLGTITRDNLCALIQVLNQELPGPVHASEDLPIQSAAAERGAVHYLVRINQTGLAIIEDLTHNSAQSVAAA
jgi:hypothetical protein